MNFLQKTNIAVLILSALSVSSAQAAPIKFYWSETADWGVTANNAGVVNSANFDGTGQTTIANGFNRIDDVEIDSKNNQVYWTNWASGPPTASLAEGIFRSNLDGTAQTQFTSGPQSDSPTGFASGMHGLDIDPHANGGAGELYFSRGVSYATGPGGGHEVSKVNLNGTGYTQLNTNNQAWFMGGVAVDTSTNTLYFGSPGVLNTGTGGSVNSVQTNGAGQINNIVPHVNGLGRAMAFDPNASTNGLLFVTSSAIQNPSLGGGIWTLDIGSMVFNQIFSSSLGGIPDIELDTTHGTAYFTEFGTTGSCGVQIPCTSLNGSISSIDYTGAAYTQHINGLTNAFGLALEFQAVPTPTTAALLAFGLIGTGFMRKRANRKNV